MRKVGTVADILPLKDELPEEVYQEALNIVTMLDEMFGEDRDIDLDDGGFVMIAHTAEDLESFTEEHVPLDSDCLEYVDYVKTSSTPYLNAFYLVNEHEFGISLFLPIDIAPNALLKRAIQEINENKAAS